MAENFAFIFNLLKYKGELPRKVIPGITFNKAEQTQFREILRFLAGDGKMGQIGGLQIYTVRSRSQKPKGGWSYEKLPSNEVVFWVLNSEKATSFKDLEIPFLLITPEIEWGASFTKGSSNRHLQKTFQFFHSNLYPIHSVIEDSNFDEVAELHALMKNPVGSKLEVNAMITRVLQNFASSRNWVRQGHSALLNHFGLIEALITHKPEVGLDSLVHQVSTKMPLLSRRFRNPVDPTEFFKITDPEKIWKKLYEVRSAFAHGGMVDFKQGQLSQLVDFQSVERFVYLSLKSLLKQALREPDLIFDLKSC